MTDTKKQLGQYYTKNYEIILNDIHPPKSQQVIEPFVGDGSLLPFIEKYEPKSIEMYDIQPTITNPKLIGKVIVRDTLKNPPELKDKFIITNPPYLARNKSKDKTIFDTYDENDLYKCFIRHVINQKPIGGIMIIPVNFWSSMRKSDIIIRKDFVSVFKITRINIFEEQVFNDTTYSVSSFMFLHLNESKKFQLR